VNNPHDPWHDWLKRYRGTFFHVEVKGHKYLGACTGCHDNQKIWYFSSEHLGKVSVRFGSTKYKLDYSYPTMGFFVSDNRLLYLERRNMRQWKRGMCQDTLELCEPQVGPTVVTRGALEDAFNPEYAENLTDALVCLSSNEVTGIPLSNQWAIQLSGQTTVNEPLLLHRSIPVGIVIPGHIELFNDTLHQEVSDFLRLNNAKDTLVWSVK